MDRAFLFHSVERWLLAKVLHSYLFHGLCTLRHLIRINALPRRVVRERLELLELFHGERGADAVYLWTHGSVRELLRKRGRRYALLVLDKRCVLENAVCVPDPCYPTGAALMCRPLRGGCIPPSCIAGVMVT